MLGFRKEWLAELEGKMKACELPRKHLFLEPLDRRGIVEIVQGPALSERLREHYGHLATCLLRSPVVIWDPQSAEKVNEIDFPHRRFIGRTRF